MLLTVLCIVFEHWGECVGIEVGGWAGKPLEFYVALHWHH